MLLLIRYDMIQKVRGVHTGRLFLFVWSKSKNTPSSFPSQTPLMSRYMIYSRCYKQQKYFGHWPGRKIVNHIIEYSGYRAMIEYDEDDEMFVGTVLGISDSVSFHGHNIQEARQHFKNNVDKYVTMCRQFRKQPEKEYHF